VLLDLSCQNVVHTFPFDCTIPLTNRVVQMAEGLALANLEAVSRVVDGNVDTFQLTATGD
jgi:hypothetical protein